MENSFTFNGVMNDVDNDEQIKVMNLILVPFSLTIQDKAD